MKKFKKKIKKKQEQVVTEEEIRGEEQYRKALDVEKDVIDLRLQKLTCKQIGEKLGLSTVKVSRILRQYARSTAIALNTRNVKVLSRAEIQSKIHEYVPDALEVVKNLSTGAKKEEVQLSASKDILDRGGFKPVEKHFHYHAVEEMSRDQLIEGFQGVLQSIKDRLSRDSAPVVEIKAEEK